MSKIDHKAMADDDDDDVVRVRRNSRTDHVVPVIRPRGHKVNYVSEASSISMALKLIRSFPSARAFIKVRSHSLNSNSDLLLFFCIKYNLCC